MKSWPVASDLWRHMLSTITSTIEVRLLQEQISILVRPKRFARLYVFQDYKYDYKQDGYGGTHDVNDLTHALADFLTFVRSLQAFRDLHATAAP